MKHGKYVINSKKCWGKCRKLCYKLYHYRQE